MGRPLLQRLAVGGWRLAVGGWRLAVGGAWSFSGWWGLEVGGGKRERAPCGHHRTLCATMCSCNRHTTEAKPRPLQTATPPPPPSPTPPAKAPALHRGSPAPNATHWDTDAAVVYPRDCHEPQNKSSGRPGATSATAPLSAFSVLCPRACRASSVRHKSGRDRTLGRSGPHSRHAALSTGPCVSHQSASSPSPPRSSRGAGTCGARARARSRAVPEAAQAMATVARQLRGRSGGPDGEEYCADGAVGEWERGVWGRGTPLLARALKVHSFDGSNTSCGSDKGIVCAVRQHQRRPMRHDCTTRPVIPQSPPPQGVAGQQPTSLKCHPPASNHRKKKRDLQGPSENGAAESHISKSCGNTSRCCSDKGRCCCKRGRGVPPARSTPSPVVGRVTGSQLGTLPGFGLLPLFCGGDTSHSSPPTWRAFTHTGGHAGVSTVHHLVCFGVSGLCHTYPRPSPRPPGSQQDLCQPWSEIKGHLKLLKCVELTRRAGQRSNFRPLLGNSIAAP